MTVVQASLVAKSFVEKVFHHHIYSFSCQVRLAEYYFFTCLCSRISLPRLYVVRSKAISIATYCDVELRPSGYKNKVQNYYSIRLEKLSNIDHCYVLRIYSI